MIEPGIRSGELPPFHKMDAYRFEELCRDLLGAESSIATCDIYGDPGQAQDGIDLLACRIHSDGIEVGQCKCYEDFPPQEIREASDKFFEHWNHWSEKDVRRFILFVASDLKTRQRQDEVLKQQERFKQVGIVYEAWSAATICNKLRPHPGIVATYLEPRDYWVSIICGTALPVSGYGSQPLDTVQIALKNQLDQLATRLADVKGEHIEHLREAWREGRKEKTLQGIEELKADPVSWPFLPPHIQAKLLRFEASVVLHTAGDLTRSKELADEAHKLAPTEDESLLRALIAYTEFGPEVAIFVLTNDQNIDSRNLKAAFLLQAGHVDEGRALLDFENNGFEPNSETFRLRALIHLQEKAIDSAQLEVQKAVEFTPRWESVRYTLAIINYFSALSSAALPDIIVPWPEPVEWPLIKQDPDSLERLQAAGKTFEEMAAEVGESSEERQRLQAWRLACLANDFEKQEIATEYCQAMLNEDATDFRALSWAVARGFDLDLSGSEVALEAFVASNSATIPHILALVGCYVAAQKLDLAIQLLDCQRPMFENAPALSLWILWYVQLLIAKGEIEKALTYVDQVSAGDELSLAYAIILRAQSRLSGDWQATLEFLDSSYAKTHNPKFLFDACEWAAQAKHWEYVADRAEELVEAVETEAALRLAAYGTFNTQHYEVCLKLLEHYTRLCSDQVLPRDLRQRRALCYQALGILPSAVTELEKIAQETPSIENLAALAQVYIEMGDLKGLAIVSRQLSQHPNLNAQIVLSIVQFLRLEDLNLARTLWRQTVAQELPDTLVGAALSLGYQLGLDQELRPLTDRMMTLARQERGGIFLKHIEDLVQMAPQWREHTIEVQRLYLEGKVPVHLVAEQLHLTLVDLYRYQLLENERATDVLRSVPILARHGNRSLVSGFPDRVPEWRLHLDITSLLLAAHLDILDAVEDVFAPIFIPAELIPTLVYMREKITYPQPSQLEIYRHIIDLADRDVFRIVTDKPITSVAETVNLVGDLGSDWLSFFEQAQAGEGYLVDFLPLHKRGTSQLLSDLPDVVTQSVINCRSIVEALHLYGPLSNRDYKEALNRLGSQGITPSSRKIPELGVPLYFYANTPDVLTGADLFRDVCTHFQVYIEQRELDRARAALKAYQQTQNIDQWLENLATRLREGLENGTYKVLPRFVDKEKRWDTDKATENPEVLCLLSLLTFETHEGDVIWIDDRYGNSFARRDMVPIVGVNEALKALVSAKKLDVNAYYDKLSRLRAANVRFILVQADEILYHLRQARIENGALVETRQLANLRRYVAACLSQGEILQQPSAPGSSPNPEGEVAFPLTIHHALAEALLALWRVDIADNIRIAQAEWIVTNLYVDYLGLRMFSPLPRMDRANQHYLFATSFASLLSQAIILAPSPETPHSPRKQYFDWLMGRMLGPKLDANPQLIVTVTDSLKRLMQVHLGEEQDNRRIIAALLQAFYEDLPEPIREGLQQDVDFTASIGIKTEMAFYLDDLYFPQEQFWQAATGAVNGHEAVITPKEMTENITFKPVSRTDRNGGQFCFRHPVSSKTVIVKGDEFELLRNSPTEREAVLLRNRGWFDCPETEFRQEVARIASITDPKHRFEEIEAWRNTSAPAYYENLHRVLSEHRRFQFSELIPSSATGLLRHFRLTSQVAPDQAFQEILTLVAQQLIDEEGLPTAIDRLSGLPIPFPPPVVETVAKLSSEDKRKLFRQLLRIAGSPLSKFHLIALLVRFDDETPSFGRLAQHIALGLVGSEAETQFEAFLAVLRWTYSVFYCWPETSTWSAHIRLAMVWAHTHRLFSTFMSVGADPIWIRDTFTHTIQRRLAVEAFERNPDLWFDAAHPRRISRITMLFDGLCYGFGEQVIVLEEIRNRLFAEAFIESEDTILPVYPLLTDTTQARNALGTFLYGDSRRELPLLSATQRDGAPTIISLQDWITQAVNTLNETKDALSAWFALSAGLGDLPPRPDLVFPLNTLFGNTDYVELFKKDERLGHIAIQTATIQIVNLHNEPLRQYLKDQMYKIAQHYVKSGTKVTLDNAVGNYGQPVEMRLLLIEAALNVSLAVEPGQDRIEEFIQLLSQLISTWTAMIPVCKSIVQILVEELPIEQSQKFWPLLMRLRAE